MVDSQLERGSLGGFKSFMPRLSEMRQAKHQLTKSNIRRQVAVKSYLYEFLPDE
jgi:hypothetical protein